MLTLHFDYPSPASAVALLRLHRLAEAGHGIRFVGLDSLGLDVSVPATVTQLDELERHHARAIELGLPMRRPSRYPPTLAAHLIGNVADHLGRGTSWREVCLLAYWKDDADLADEEVLLGLALRAGLDATAVGAALDDRQLRNALRGRMATRRRSGIGGVPVLESDGGVYVSADLPDADLAQLAAL